MTTYTVGYFVGSLAKASINRKLAGALVKLAPASLQMREIPHQFLDGLHRGLRVLVALQQHHRHLCGMHQRRPVALRADTFARESLIGRDPGAQANL